ncbi:hypothetical protein HN588_01405 [Candidatus Bathyarchaeota archaeon]|nr:hypothetical protein [Candidatus Bathyarchaeota archaeon]
MEQTEVEHVMGVGIDSGLEKEEKRLREFKGMLDSMTTLEDKKKILWVHIYENALQDRRNAYALLFELIGGIKGNTAEHHLNGPVLAKYIERMSKANDQILKLADLIQKAQEETDSVSEDEIWRELEKK